MDDPQDAKGWPTRSGVLTNETRETQLAQLIGEVFTPEDLRRFVRYGPKGDEIARRLPFASNMLTLAVEFVDEYRRYGLIDSAFFDRIADFRPSEAARIRTVEKLWVDEPGSSAPAEHSLTRTGGGPERLMRAKPLRIFVSYSHRDRALVEE